MAAAALSVAGLIAFVAGDGEAEGYLTGERTIGLTDLPFGPDKAEHVEMLGDLARENHVSLALLVPERSGTPDSIDAYVLNGSVASPTFWGTLVERPADAVGDAVIVWTYAIDGETDDMSRFLVALAGAGFAYVDETPSPLIVVPVLLGQPGVLALAAVVAIGVLIALVAESDRRAPRQRARRLTGWSHRRIATRELLDVVLLAAVVFGVVLAALAAFLAVRGAGPSVWMFCAAQAVIVVPVVVAAIATSHVGLALLGGLRVGRPEMARWRPILVGSAAVGLVILLVSSATVARAQLDVTAELERSLAAEAARGNDVTLGVGLADEHEDLLLGHIAMRALGRGTASMAMTNALADAVVVLGDMPGVPSAVKRRDGVTVLLPDALAINEAAIIGDVRESIADGWEVDDASPPRVPPLHARVVETTAPIVEPIARWVDWALQEDGRWPEIPVVVVSDPKDLAPNRIGTAAHNGEVRFSDRTALVRELREADVLDVVTQINRVGAIVERRLAEVRNERVVVLVATIGAGVAAVFAAGVLAADHRVRSRRASRVRSLTGRHPITDHLTFVIVAAVTCSATTLVTLAMSGAVPAVAMVGSSLVAAVTSAGVLALLLLLSRPRGRTLR